MVNLISRFVDFSGFWEVAQEFKVEKYFRYKNVLYRLKQFCPRMTSRTSCWRHKLSIILSFVCADKRLWTWVSHQRRETYCKLTKLILLRGTENATKVKRHLDSFSSESATSHCIFRSFRSEPLQTIEHILLHSSVQVGSVCENAFFRDLDTRTRKDPRQWKRKQWSSYRRVFVSVSLRMEDCDCFTNVCFLELWFIFRHWPSGHLF